MNRRIGVDIDGVLNDFYTFVIELVKNEYGIQLDVTNYEIMPQLNQYTEDGFFEFLNKHEQQLAHVPTMPGALASINKIRAYGIKVFLLTARSNNEKNKTLDWLNKHGFKYDGIEFDCGNKVNACLRNKVDLIIDDSPRNVNALNDASILTIRFEHPYNARIFGDNIEVARNWDEVLAFLTIFYKLK